MATKELCMLIMMEVVFLKDAEYVRANNYEIFKASFKYINLEITIYLIEVIGLKEDLIAHPTQFLELSISNFDNSVFVYLMTQLGNDSIIVGYDDIRLLIIAIQRGAIKAVKYLFEKVGMNLNVLMENDTRILILAEQQTRVPEIATYLNERLDFEGAEDFE